MTTSAARRTPEREDEGFAAVLDERRDRLSDELRESTQTDVSRLAAQELQTASAPPPPPEPKAAATGGPEPRRSVTAERLTDARRSEPTANAAATTSTPTSVQPNQAAPNARAGARQAVSTTSSSQVAAVATPARAASPPISLMNAASVRGPGVQPAAKPVTSVGGIAAKDATGRDALARLNTKPTGPRFVADDTVAGQISRGLEAALRQGGGRVMLRLNPENLGPVAVRLNVRGTSVDATLEPRTEAARQLLADSVDTLRAALEARGLSVERIEIDVSRIDPRWVPPGDARIASPGGEGGRGGNGPPREDVPRGHVVDAGVLEAARELVAAVITDGRLDAVA